MCASLETLTIAAYVFATTFRMTRPGPEGKVTDAEIVALAVAQAITGLVCDRKFLGTIDRLLPGLFPDVPDQTQYNRRLRRLTPHVTTVQLIDIELITAAKHKASQRPAAEIAKARIRLVIESVFATLKRQMGQQDHLAKTLPGLVGRIAQRLLALTLGIYLNTLLGRPPRAPAAYDGR